MGVHPHNSTDQIDQHPLEVKRLPNTAEAAKFLNRSENTLRVARVRGNGPAFRKFGRTVRYAVKDLIDYVDRAKRTSTSQAA
ncbi:MAG: helix-turn-helix domain-containing protein [Devosia sp.]|nr:helix-turn-helix domain-containing protein [Devosia sp.]